MSTLLEIEIVQSALSRHPVDQEALCMQLLLHVQKCMQDKDCEEDRLNHLLTACVHCAPQHMLATVHHQRAVVALHCGQLDLAMEASEKELACIETASKLPKLHAGKAELNSTKDGPAHGRMVQPEAVHRQLLACKILQLRIFMLVCF